MSEENKIDSMDYDMLDLTEESVPEILDSPEDAGDSPEVDTSDLLEPIVPDGPTDISEPSTNEGVVITQEDSPTVTTPEISLEELDFESLSPREKALIARLEEVTGERIALSQNGAPPSEPEPTPSGDHNFLEGLDIDDVLQSPEDLNNLLNKVYTRALNDAKTLAAEQIMSTLPRTIATHYAQQTAQTKLVENFYNENKDLAYVKKTVAAVANDIATNHPDYTLDQVFNEAATRTRKMLGLRKTSPQMENTPPTTTQRPAFAGQRSSGNRVRVPELTGIAAEVSELISDL